MTTDADSRFTAIADELSADGVLTGALFGGRSLTVGGTAFACLRRDRLAVRLGGDPTTYAEALALDGAAVFDPSGRGRPFEDWVAVPLDHADRWPALVAAGLATIAG